MIPSRSDFGLTAAWCLFWLTGLALAQPDVHDRPLNAENAWPSGSYGVDHSTLDAEGLQADVHRDNNAITFDLEREQEARQSH